MELESIAGLPAHPLLVHAPVVLLPLAAICAVLAVFWRGGRRPLALATLALGWAGFVGAVLAAGSGEALEESLSDVNRSLVNDHAELGEGLRIVAFLFAIAATVFAAVIWRDRLPGRDGGLGRLLSGRAAFLGSAVALVVLAGITTGWTIQTGHSGAKAVWQEEWSQRAEAAAPSAPPTDLATRVPAAP